MHRLQLAIAIGICFLASRANAADPTIQIKQTRIIRQANTTRVVVRFDQILDAGKKADLESSNINVITDTTVIPAVDITRDPNQIVFNLANQPPSGAESLKVCFVTIHFVTDGKSYASSDQSKLCSTTKILDSQAATELVNSLNTAAQKKAADKTSGEKNIFASGFVTTAGNGKTDGGADISLNGVKLAQDTTGFLRIKKTSTNGGDPRHFETGAAWRHVHLLQADVDTAVDDAVRRFHDGSADHAAAAAEINVATKRYGVWAGVIQAWEFKLEGDPTHFQAVNVVADGSAQFQTRTQKLFGSTNGWWRSRIIVPGFEGGRSLSQDTATAGTTTSATTPATKVDWLARAKTGFEFTAYYHNPRTQFLFKRVEANAGVVERYLFLNEKTYDSTAKKDISVGKGSHPYFEADVKVFLAEDSAGRYGLRVAYSRGSLPPVFADVKSFQFGFVYESADDKVKAK